MTTRAEMDEAIRGLQHALATLERLAVESADSSIPDRTLIREVQQLIGEIDRAQRLMHEAASRLRRPLGDDTVQP